MSISILINQHFISTFLYNFVMAGIRWDRVSSVLPALLASASHRFVKLNNLSLLISKILFFFARQCRTSAFMPFMLLCLNAWHFIEHLETVGGYFSLSSFSIGALMVLSDGMHLNTCFLNFERSRPLLSNELILRYRFWLIMYDCGEQMKLPGYLIFVCYNKL